MAITKTSHSLNTYTNDTWTDLVAGSANGNTLKTIILANTSASAISVQIQVTNSAGTSQAIILPSTTISAGSTQTLLLELLNLTNSQKLQIYASASGMNFYASGVSY